MKNGRLYAFPGQITISEYLERIEAAAEKTAESYLDKGERLTTLARQKFERMMDRLSFSALEKKIFQTKIPDFADPGTIVDILSKSVIRPIIKAMTTFDESDEAYMSLKGVIDFDFTLMKADKGLNWIPAYKYLKYRQKKTEDILILTVREEGWPDITVLGYRAYALDKKRCDLLWPDGSAAADIGLVLSWLLVFTLYNRAMEDGDMEAALAEAFSENMVSHYELRKYVLRSSGIDPEIHGYDNRVPCYTCKEEYRGLSDSVQMLFNKATGSTITERTEYADDILRNRNREQLSNISNPKPFGYLVEPGVEWLLLKNDPVSPMNAFKNGVGRAVYNRFLVRDTSKKRTDGGVPLAWALPKLYRATGNDGFTIVLTRVLHALWEKKGVIAEVYEYYDGLRKEGKRSKVYQTKKNIPQKVLKDMEESTLNEYFGYVEFDESVDLDAMKVVSNEFEAFKTLHLPSLDVSEVSVRFRLLGNYKAAGIFFPSINCLCVDVRHPASFIHELGHAIDYLGGRLSEKKGFASCYRAYKEAFMRDISYGKLKELKNKKIKHNLDYYLLPTEVFARCMEMYVSRVLGVDLSICKIEEEMDWAYPCDVGLMGQVTEYFEALFSLYAAADETAA